MFQYTVYTWQKLHRQQEIQFPLEDRLQWMVELWVVELWVVELWMVELWVVELWVVELCGKGMQLVALDEQEVQILSLVEMLQMRVCTVAQH